MAKRKWTNNDLNCCIYFQTAVEPAAEYVKSKTDQLAKQYRKVVAPTTIKVINKVMSN